MSAPDPKKVVVLGSTGSIGKNTLDVIARHPQRFEVLALTANTSVPVLLEQARQFKPRFLVTGDDKHMDLLRQGLQAVRLDSEVLSGPQALVTVAAHEDADYVMAAIVGAAGLLPTLAAVRAGKRVLLANKEVLVMTGQLFMSAVAASGAELLPIDSEHNAIYQCLPAPSASAAPAKCGVSSITLTASGGPFRDWPLDHLATVTPDQACAHPNWSMGRKISVDSATMMNKGLELIEACWLFDLPADAVKVLIHKQSIVHSMVSYEDGSVLAQLGHPDMRTPIAYGLGWPERIASGVSPLDLATLGQLHFEALDNARFPAVAMAIAAMNTGGTATTALNAANEVAVEAFLNERIGFRAMGDLIDCVMQSYCPVVVDSLEQVLEEDHRVRVMATQLLEKEWD